MKKIALAGFGMEGKAAYEWLNGTATLEIFDERKIHDAPVPSHIGLTIPADFDIVYKTPGIPSRKIQCESPATKITTLMNDVLEQVGPQAVGITGTKGKSTVASLVTHILNESGKKVELLGNIGAIDMKLLEAPEDTIFVIELSSYQLEHVEHSPHVAVLTNLYPEHLTHHGSFEAYEKAKMNINKFQNTDDIFIDGRKIKNDVQFETKLLGEHNQHNCATAVEVVKLFDVSQKQAREHIQTFAPLPSRLELVGEFGGLTFYDDALSTIPEATCAAINALSKVDTLILGGEDRGLDFTSFGKELAKTDISTFIVFPDTGPNMVGAVQDRTIAFVSTMQEAVRLAYAHTPQGGTVLLSNASPSFNLFKDYKDRSAQYREQIVTQAT